MNEKHSELMDIGTADVDLPDSCFLCFAVCAGEEHSCGWGGWMLEGTFKNSNVQHNDKVLGQPLPQVSLQICPNCRGPLFRTAAYVRMNFQNTVVDP